MLKVFESEFFLNNYILVLFLELNGLVLLDEVCFFIYLNEGYFKVFSLCVFFFLVWEDGDIF